MSRKKVYCVSPCPPSGINETKPIVLKIGELEKTKRLVRFFVYLFVFSILCVVALFVFVGF